MSPLDELKAIPGRGQARSDFLTHRAFIAEAISNGHAYKVVWKLLHGKGQFRASYRQFGSYVAEYITGKKSGADRPPLDFPAPATAPD